jgi:hypothetical protein
VESCLLRLQQLLFQSDEFGLEFDDGVRDDVDAKAARAAEVAGPGVVDLSMSPSCRSMRRETAASGGMSSVLKPLKALNTGSLLVFGILFPKKLWSGEAGRRTMKEPGRGTAC